MDKIEIIVDKSDSENIKDKIMKCKIICLHNMGKHPLLNTKYFNKTDKDTLLKNIKNMLETLSYEEITNKFNEICSEVLFCNDSDYTNYPIYENKR